MRRLFLAIFTLASAAPIHGAVAQGLLVPRSAEVRCRPGAPCRPCPTRGGVVRVRSDVRVELGAGVLRYEVSETFVKNGGALGEADYIFPLPRNAALRDLRLMINGELVSGETMDADRARAIYEEIAAPTRQVRVQPFSELYFALIRQIPEMREIVALGERVLAHGRHVTIELHPEGASRLGASEWNAIIRDW